MSTEGILNLAAATASLVDVDLSRKTRGDALEWRHEDVEFMEEQRQWHELSLKHREEDMKWRRQETQQRDLMNRRREIDEKNEQLKNIASVAALIAGFSVVVLVEMNFSETTPEWLLTLYAATSATTVCLMTYAFVTCTLILVGTLKKFEVNQNFVEEESLFMTLNLLSQSRNGQPLDDSEEATLQHQRSALHKTRFIVFWESTCEGDWNRAYTSFSLGVPSFLLNMIVVGWVKFLPTIWPGIVVTVVCGSTIIFLFWTSHMKWGTFLTETPQNGAPQPTNPVAGES